MPVGNTLCIGHYTSEKSSACINQYSRQLVMVQIGNQSFGYTACSQIFALVVSHSFASWHVYPHQSVSYAVLFSVRRIIDSFLQTARRFFLAIYILCASPFFAMIFIAVCLDGSARLFVFCCLIHFQMSVCVCACLIFPSALLCCIRVVFFLHAKFRFLVQHTGTLLYTSLNDVQGWPG